MDIALTSEERDRIELLAIQAGRPASRLLLEAAQLLLDQDAADTQRTRAWVTQQFLSETDLEARFITLLRY